MLAGSTARRDTTETFPAGYRTLRDRLLADGLLTADPASDLFTFTSDTAFSSPSAAAAIVAGRSASGPREWKVERSGLTYGEWVVTQDS